MATAVVTGASRGVGRGIATALAAAGYTVHATGRTIDSSDLPSSIIRHRCDHQNDADTEAVFRAVAESHDGQVLVGAEAALAYAIADEDGKQPRPLTLADV